MTIGESIKSARKAAGLTQKELAQRLGLSFQSIAQWENDLRKPKIETLKKIADALGCTISDFDEELPPLMSVGDNIRYWRKYKGLTEQEFGEKAGISPDVVKKYENGSLTPKRTDVKKMAQALDDTPDLLYLDTDFDTDRWSPERYAWRDLASYIKIMGEILLNQKGNPTPLTPEIERTWAYNEIPFIAQKYGIEETWLRDAYDNYALGSGASDISEMVDALPTECQEIIDIMNFMNAAGRQIAVQRVSELAQLIQYQNSALFEVPDEDSDEKA